ncbi:uncharacterized protein [Nicotiana sylvestris]|uniref:uncharacterized protein n=1 Tax=Nicotiana sylvestris TaxID=4096 RepID=UPI00388C4866
MTSKIQLPTITPSYDSSLLVIPMLESAAAEENRSLRRRMLEMWEALSNRREPPSAIPGFPELIPRTSGTSNIPINYPSTPFGYPTMSAHFTRTPFKVRPQTLVSGVSSNIFTTPQTSATIRLTLPIPSFELSSFTFQIPPFQSDMAHFTTNSYPEQPRYEFTVGPERTTKNHEQEEITRKMKSMEQSLKNIQGLRGQKSVSYADLCMFSHVHFPIGFKTPKFEKYDGHGYAIAHLKRYCNQLRGAGWKEKLLMAYFGESLVGIVSECYMDQDISRWHIWDDLARDFVRQFQYNVDIAPDRNSCLISRKGLRRASESTSSSDVSKLPG